MVLLVLLVLLVLRLLLLVVLLLSRLLVGADLLDGRSVRSSLDVSDLLRGLLLGVVGVLLRVSVVAETKHHQICLPEMCSLSLTSSKSLVGRQNAEHRTQVLNLSLIFIAILYLENLS